PAYRTHQSPISNYFSVTNFVSAMGQYSWKQSIWLWGVSIAHLLGLTITAQPVSWTWMQGGTGNLGSPVYSTKGIESKYTSPSYFDKLSFDFTKSRAIAFGGTTPSDCKAKFCNL